MKLRFVISFLFFMDIWGNSLSYASQSLPKGIVNHHQTLNNKFKLSNNLLEGGSLTEKPFTSHHLELFDRDQSDQTIYFFSPTVEEQLTSSSDIVSDYESQAARIGKVVSSKKYLNEIFNVAKEYNIDPLLLHAIAEVESSYNSVAVSSAGAKGLMQIMPDTARRFGMKNPDKDLFDPRDNLRISSNYLRSLHSLFGNNLKLILAAYNAGENAVIKYGYTIPPYRETQRYVTKVLNRYLELKNQSIQF